MNSSIADVLSGRARYSIIHGDCLEVMPLISEVDHVIGDPPFTQRVSDGARTRAGATEYGESFGLIDFDGIDGMEAEIARRCISIAARWSILFCAFEQLGAYAEAAGDSWVRSGVWRKPDATPQFNGKCPAMCGEAVAIMRGRAPMRWNGGGHPAFWEHVREHDRPDHPTPKPVPLMLELVELFTDSGELVLDPFAGSGTTGVACLRLGRRFIGIEKDAKYAALARERLEAESKGLTLRAARHGQLPMFSTEAAR